MRAPLTLGTAHSPYVNVCAPSELISLGLLHLGDVVVIDSYILERQMYTLVEATVRR